MNINHNESANEKSQKELVPVSEPGQMNSNWNDCIESFDELGINPDLLRGINEYGLERPTPIQQNAILPIIQGRDVIALAPHGTGKTTTCAIGTLQLIEPDKDEVQTLILAPTRELAQQNSFIYSFLGEYVHIKVHLVIRIAADLEKLAENPHVVIGTPGRILDLIKKKKLNLMELKSFVLDEADEMFSKGFLDHIKELINYIAPTTKILLFSETMTEDIVALTTQFMNDPAKICLKNKELILNGIKQYYVYEKQQFKLDLLLQLSSWIEFSQWIIYCTRKTTMDFINEELKKKGYMVSSIHCDLKPNLRDKILQDFRCGRTKVLITTDLISRDIDVYQVSHIINFDLPRDKETYIRWIGTCFRYGRKVTVINFVTPEEKDKLEIIQTYYDSTIESLPTDFSEIK